MNTQLFLALWDIDPEAAGEYADLWNEKMQGEEEQGLYLNLNGLLICAFAWNKTGKGADYWTRIDNILDAIGYYIKK